MSCPPELVRDGLRRLFAAYIAATGETSTAACRRYAGDGSFLTRLDTHRTTPRKAAGIVRKFSAAWPKSIAWPADVPRRDLDLLLEWGIAPKPDRPLPKTQIGTSGKP